MKYWRDCQQVIATRFIEDDVRHATAIEEETGAGIFWGIVWAFQYGKSGSRLKPTTEHLRELVNQGISYRVLVDTIKSASYGGVQIDLNVEQRMMTVYEGGNTTGHDHSIVDSDHASNPFHHHNAYVDDSDQLTKRWTAGEYRAYWRWLSEIAIRAESRSRTDFWPVIFRVPCPPPEFANVQDDLTLTEEKASNEKVWSLGQLDCPLVRIGSNTYAISSVVIGLAPTDDYMLRLAVYTDSNQYSKVSGLREGRMVERSTEALQASGWDVRPHFRLTNPERELDIYATRGGQVLVIQLKSVLRPHSPWEVFKRNQDIIGGIRHTAEALARLGANSRGFVITDGYAGDYMTWRESLTTRIPVATLEDLGPIARDPDAAFENLKEAAGISGLRSSEPVPEREVDIQGWKIRLVDSAPPKRLDPKSHTGGASPS
jgi:hypothetical protein